MSSVTQRRVSIGILAWNEASSIGRTIASIFGQDLVCHMTDEVAHLEILCVANGCTDNTAAIARSALQAAVADRPGLPISASVHELQIASKENAWNVFVHSLSDPIADYLILMDGDVSIRHRATISNLVKSLDTDASANLAGARTVKHIELSESKSLWERLSLSASEMRRSMPGQFAGCLYCARAATLRRVLLPKGLVGEDSFLGAMIKTDMFTRPSNHSRIIVPDDASVVFEAYTSPTMIMRNLKRRAVGLTVNSILYDHLWRHSTAESDAAALVAKWTRENSNWAHELVVRHIRQHNRWPFQARVMLKWFTRLSHVSRGRALLLAPAALVGTVLETTAHLAAWWSLRRGSTGALWFNTATTHLPTEHQDSARGATASCSPDRETASDKRQ